MVAASSASACPLTTWAAVMPAVWSMRMSKGPSCLKEKPRSGWSSCIDDTPASRMMPSTGASLLPSPWATIPTRSRALPWTNVTLLPKRARRSRAILSASRSRSMPTQRPCGDEASRMASRCPPAPAVRSTYVPPERGARSAKSSRRMTGACGEDTAFRALNPTLDPSETQRPLPRERKPNPGEAPSPTPRPLRRERGYPTAPPLQVDTQGRRGPRSDGSVGGVALAATGAGE